METRIITSSANANPTDELIICNSASDIVLNLPVSVGEGRDIIIKNIGTGNVYVSSPSLIDGENSKSLSQYDSINLLDYVVGSWISIRFIKKSYTDIASLDLSRRIKTVKKTIGNVGVTGCDYNFTSAANKTEQCINLGAIIPAKARLIDVFVFTDAAFTNLGALTSDVGLTTGTNGLITAADNTALNAILQPAVGAAFTLIAISASAQNVWVNVVPANNWNSATPVGKMSVYITYIDITSI